MREALTDGDNIKLSLAQLLIKLGINNDDYLNATKQWPQGLKPLRLKRRPCEANINNYNPEVRAWEGNIDLQVVTDTFALFAYVAPYLTKDESGLSALLKELTKEDSPEGETLFRRLGRYASLMLTAREVSAQEVALRAISGSMRWFSRSTIGISTVLPEDRIGYIKSKFELADLGDSIEGTVNKNMFDFYKERDSSVEHMPLIVFAMLYNRGTKCSSYDNED